MISANADSTRHFHRDRDRAILGGVCAGLAAHLGFNLKVTRCLAFIAFLMAMPVTVIAYLAAVFFTPSVAHGENHVSKEWRCCRRRKARKESATTESSRRSIAGEIDRRCQSLDERLAILEKHVTSKRFQIEQELSRL